MKRLRYYKDTFNIVHIPWLFDGRNALKYLALIKILRYRVIATLHGYGTLALIKLYRSRGKCIPQNYFNWRLFLRRHARRILGWYFARTLIDHVITPSIAEKRNLVEVLQLPEDKVTAIHHGVNHNIFKEHKVDVVTRILEQYHLSYKSYVLHVSRYQPKKNVERIIAAFAYLKRKLLSKRLSSKLKLVLVGNQPYDRLLKFVARLGLHAQDVIYLSNIPENDLAILYNGAICLTFPSLHESFGMPLVEAMACGCPVVTSNVYAPPEIVGDAGILVDPFNIKAMAYAIHNLVTDESLRKELRRRALKRAKAFSWEKCALEHLKVYKSVITSR